MKNIAVIGTSMIDILIGSDSELNNGLYTKAGIRQSQGGSMRNIAWHCARCGLPVTFISKFSHDDQGLDLINELQKAGCIVHGPVVDHPTPYFVHVQDPVKEYRLSSISDDFLFHGEQELIPYCLIRDCGWGITDQKDPEFLNKLLLKCPETRWIFSGGIPCDSALSKITGILLNRQEMEACSNDLTMAEKARQLIQKGVQWILVTLDKEGAILITKERTVPFAALSEQKDRIGSGDAFACGLLQGLVKDLSIEESIPSALENADIYLKSEIFQPL